MLKISRFCKVENSNPGHFFLVPCGPPQSSFFFRPKTTFPDSKRADTFPRFPIPDTNYGYMKFPIPRFPIPNTDCRYHKFTIPRFPIPPNQSAYMKMFTIPDSRFQTQTVHRLQCSRFPIPDSKHRLYIDCNDHDSRFPIPTHTIYMHMINIHNILQIIQ